jgi:GNAT superfamily N-acetyltransferase
MGEIAVVSAGLERLDELVAFWMRLHRHQGAVAEPITGVPVLSEDASAAIVREMYRDWLGGGEGFALLAEDDGRPVGYLVAFYEDGHFMWDTGRIGHVDSFYVLPELRGRGVGRLLMDRAYDLMRDAGVRTVALEMVATNDVARRFYEREGFTTTFVQMHRQLPTA